LIGLISGHIYDIINGIVVAEQEVGMEYKWNSSSRAGSRDSNINFQDSPERGK